MFFAGVGTTFAILAVGFSGGLIIANTAMGPEPVSQSPAAVQNKEEPAVRVVLPASNEPAHPHVPSFADAIPPAPALGRQQPATSVQQPKQEARQKPLEHVDKTEKSDTKKEEAEERDRKRRNAEGRARRQAEARARELRKKPREQAGILAFGGDDEPPRAAGFFGN